MAGRKKAEKDVYAFPLAEGQYFSTPATSPRSVSSGGAVAAIQKALSVGQSGSYDGPTRTAVIEWQRTHDLPVTGVVDTATWESLQM